MPAIADIPREAIALEVLRRLQEIGGTADYATAVPVTVYRARLTPLTAPQFPLVVFAITGETYTRDEIAGTAGVYARTMSVEIAYWADGDNPIDVALSPAVHDIEYALRDWTLQTDAAQSTSDDLRIMEYAVAIDESAAPRCGVTFTVEIDYRTNDQVPSTRM